MNYHVIAVLNYLLSFGLTVGVSMLIHKYVELPGMRLAAMTVRKKETA